MASIKRYSVITVFLLLLISSMSFGQKESRSMLEISNVMGSEHLAPASVVLTNSSQALATNTLGFTVPAGISRMLLVAVSDDNSLDIVSVSFNGIPMIQAVETNDGTAVDSFWYLTLGSSGAGTTANIVMLSSGTTPNAASVIGGYSLVGVDQASPITDTKSANLFAANVGSSLNVVSDNGDVVFDIFDGFRTTMGATITPQGGQTPVYNYLNLTVAGGFAYYGSTYKPGASPTTAMTWTSTTDAMIHIAVNVNSLTPTAAGIFIGGRVLSLENSGLPNASIQLTRPDGRIEIARSNSFGHYRFEGLQAGETYILTVQMKGYAFKQPTQVVNATENISSLDFISY